jgi:hypothetical protein
MMETLGKHFQTLAKAALQKHGFQQADILSHWVVIAGDELAQICVPDRIKWPRAAEGMRVQGGTLVVRVNPGRALDVQYRAQQLMERVNQFFGYGAIGALKVLQSATVVVAAPPPPPVLPVPSAAVQERVATIENHELKEALLRLGAQVTGRRSPQ